MARTSPLPSLLLALVSGCSLVAGLSAQDVIRAVSQAVVTPDNPLWALQDPPTPAPETPPAGGADQEAAGRGGRGQQPPQPRPYAQVITSAARTDEGVFKVHRLNEQLFFEIPKGELGKDFLWVNQIKKTTIGAGYGGQAAGQRVVRWDLLNNRVLLKVKLATALIGISSIHLLKTFINAGGLGMTETQMLWQVTIHLTFVLSAIALAWIDRLTYRTVQEAH